MTFWLKAKLAIWTLKLSKLAFLTFYWKCNASSRRKEVVKLTETAKMHFFSKRYTHKRIHKTCLKSEKEDLANILYRVFHLNFDKWLTSDSSNLGKILQVCWFKLCCQMDSYLSNVYLPLNLRVFVSETLWTISNFRCFHLLHHFHRQV